MQTYNISAQASAVPSGMILWKKAYARLTEIYGERPPLEVLNRYFCEWAEWKDTDAILHFDLQLHILQALKKRGESARSCGPIGSSFAAFLLGTSKINPLPAHYYCPQRKRMEVHKDINGGKDLPEKRCLCGAPFEKDGHNIPYEVLRSALSSNEIIRLEIDTALVPVVQELVRQYFGSCELQTQAYDEDNSCEILVLSEGSEFRLSVAAPREIVPCPDPADCPVFCRDDLFHHILQCTARAGLEGSGLAYRVMEKTRKGLYFSQGLPAALKSRLYELGVEAAAIEALEEIKYLPAKAAVIARNVDTF